MSFKEEYAKFTKPSPEREAFVLKTLLSLPREQIVRNMRSVTVKKPDGSTVTYKVMPDYITVDGMRVPMSGNTAQTVADHFGLSLPSAQMAQDIYNNADVKVVAQPLSGTGTTIDGRHYSPNDVVRNQGVGYAPFAVSYNDKINQQLADKGVNPGGKEIVSGFAKDIVAPPAPGKLGLYGLYDSKGKPIQGGSGETPHDTSVHTEYGTYVRLVSPDVTITYPDGRSETKPVGQVYTAGRYAVSPKGTKSNVPKSNAPAVPDKLDQINQFLNQTMTELASARDAIKKFAATKIMPSIGKDPAIKDLSRNSIPGHAPTGYRPLRPGENNKDIGAAATKILNSSELGDQTPFAIDEQLYMGRTEPHFHPPPPKGTDPSEFKKYPKPWGWHKGVTVFKALEGTKSPSVAEEFKPPVPSGSQTRMKLLQRMQDSPVSSLDKINDLFSEIEKDV